MREWTEVYPASPLHDDDMICMSLTATVIDIHPDASYCIDHYDLEQEDLDKFLFRVSACYEHLVRLCVHAVFWEEGSPDMHLYRRQFSTFAEARTVLKKLNWISNWRINA